MAALILYALALHQVYLQVISQKFAYNGQQYQEPNVAYFGISIAMLCVASMAAPHRLKSASDFVLWVFFYLVVASVALVPHFARGVEADVALMISAVATGSFLIIGSITRKWEPRLFSDWRGLPPQAFMGLLITVTSLSLVYLGISGNLSFNVDALFDTRDTRFDYRDTLAEGSGLLGYIVRFQGYVIGPALLAYALQRKNWIGVALGLLSQISIYSLTAYKIVFLSIPLIIAIVFLYHRMKGISFALLSFVMSLTVLVGTTVDALLDQPYVSEIFINRLLVIPGFLTSAHISIFADAPKFFWSDSILSGLVPQPYATSSAFLVGYALTGGTETTANANIFASGYANAGWLGVAVELVVLVLLLFAIKACARNLEPSLVYSTLLLPAVALANSGIFAAFLTNGFAYALIVFMVSPRVKIIESGSDR